LFSERHRLNASRKARGAIFEIRSKTSFRMPSGPVALPAGSRRHASRSSSIVNRGEEGLGRPIGDWGFREEVVDDDVFSAASFDARPLLGNIFRNDSVRQAPGVVVHGSTEFGPAVGPRRADGVA